MVENPPASVCQYVKFEWNNSKCKYFHLFHTKRSSSGWVLVSLSIRFISFEKYSSTDSILLHQNYIYKDDNKIHSLSWLTRSYSGWILIYIMMINILFWVSSYFMMCNKNTFFQTIKLFHSRKSHFFHPRKSHE